MNSYDPHVPKKLKELQNWFAGIITEPIDDDSCIKTIAPSGLPIEEEAAKYILPSPTLRPAERIQIYNQQYWWRLLSTLHDGYPLVTRLFGYHDFNVKIGFPYLQKHPPHFWSLNFLGDTLPQWIENDYFEEDKRLVFEAAAVDCAFNSGFFAKELESVDLFLAAAGGDSRLLKKKLSLQPHLHLFELHYNLLPFRHEMLKEDPDYWVDHDFPLLEKKGPYYIAISRDGQGNIRWDPLSKSEFTLLKKIEKGASIEEVCQFVENGEEELLQEAGEKLHLWFQEWTAKRWLAV